jgi:hypothetical protein
MGEDMFIMLRVRRLEVALDDAPLSSLMDSTASLKMKTTKRERVGAHSLVRSTLGVEGRTGAPRCD